MRNRHVHLDVSAATRRTRKHPTKPMAIAFAATVLGACAGLEPTVVTKQQTDTTQSLVDRMAVQDIITELFVATDEKAWDRVQRLFAPEVQFDMSSLTGEGPTKMKPADIVDAWEEGLNDVPYVHHQVGNFVVKLNKLGATASCHGIATHYNPDADPQLTTFVGTYDLVLHRVGGRWVIASFTFNKKYVLRSSSQSQTTNAQPGDES